MNNFLFGMIAASNDIGLFIKSLLADKLFIGFSFGTLTTLTVTGFILSKNPAHVPLILRYSSMESFQKIAPKNTDGTFQMSYISFIKMYSQIRTLFLVAFIAFCVMIATAALMYQK